MIFNIQKCSIHDGDGLRTLIFFKGCPLRCLWCANPESQRFESEIMESPNRCIGCGACRDVCPQSAISERFLIDRSACDNCLKCPDACYAEAKQIIGQAFSVSELFLQIQKDRFFYKRYGGGVTFSGGEPLSHPEDLKAIAKKCHDNGIHVVVESCGCGQYEDFKAALPYIDVMFMDIKHIDPGRHKILTGGGNDLILENIRRIAQYGIPTTIRTPIVPGYTNDKKNIEGIARYIKELPNVREYELLAYHEFGKAKYRALGRSYQLGGVKAPEDAEMNDLVRYANQILSDSGKECFWTKNNKREAVK